MHITIHRTQLSGYSILNYQKMLKIVEVFILAIFPCRLHLRHL